MDKQRVLVTHAIPREGLDDLFDRFEVIYPEGKIAFSVDELRDILPSCAGVLACGAIDGDLIERADRLAIISSSSRSPWPMVWVFQLMYQRTSQ